MNELVFKVMKAQNQKRDTKRMMRSVDKLLRKKVK